MGNGTNRDFSIPYPFVSRNHIVVTVAGVSAPFTWLSNTTIRITTAPPNLATVLIARDSTLGGFAVDFNDASVLGEVALDTATLQSFYTSEEARALAEPVLGAVAAAQAAQEAAEAALAAANSALTTANTAVTQANLALAAGLGSDAATRVLKAGDTMTGPLALVTGAPTLAAHATRKDYVDGIPLAKITTLNSAGTGGALATANNSYVDLALPANVSRIILSGYAIVQNYSGSVEGVTFDAQVVNSSLVQQALIVAGVINVHASGVAPWASGGIGGAFTFSGANSGWRLRLLARCSTGGVTNLMASNLGALVVVS